MYKWKEKLEKKKLLLSETASTLSRLHSSTSMSNLQQQQDSIQEAPQNNDNSVTTTPPIPVTTTPTPPRNVYTITTYASSTKSDSPPQFIWNGSPRMIPAMEPNDYHHVPSLTPSSSPLEEKQHRRRQRPPLTLATNRINNTDGENENNYHNRRSSTTTTAKMKNKLQSTSTWCEEEPTKMKSSKIKGRSGKGGAKKKLLNHSFSSSSLSPIVCAPSYKPSVTQRPYRSQRKAGGIGTVAEDGSNHQHHRQRKVNKQQQSSDTSWFDDMPFISFSEV